MDKSAIKAFAIEARKILMKSAITQAGFYGVTKDGCADPIQKGAGFEVYRTIAGTENRVFGHDVNRRRKLVSAVKAQGFEQVIEETAYTWFNRLIAIRFMEVNGYLPTRTRVLSSESGSSTPDLVTQYAEVDLDMTDEELEKVRGFIKNNKYDDAFALMFVKQCNALNEILPELFEKTDDYMELLLKLSYTSDGVVRMLVDTIPESNFDVDKEGQVEIIGWMYQYYNAEKKDDVFAALKKNVKITKENIPAATQLFTPDWIVRYMVENSLGRLWVDGHPNEELKGNWKYYLEEAKQEADVQAQLEKIRVEYRNLNPEDIKVIDPCMGSGHILVYCFDVLMQIYESQGYTQRDAAQAILENNLFGLDIDKRAAQLSYFAVMMKARQFDRRIFSRGVKPHVYAIEESNTIDREQLKYFGAGLNAVEKNSALNEMEGLLDTLVDAKEYGSILNVDNYDWDLLYRFVEEVDDSGQMTWDTMGIDETKEKLSRLLEIGQAMAQKYDVVVTNPPYMGAAGMDTNLSKYVKDNYPDSKSDLFAVFIEKCGLITKENGYQAMITQHAWMFLSSYEKLRAKLLKKDTVNMAHLGARAFDEIGGEVVQTTSFVLQNDNIKKYRGVYCRLVEPTTQNGKKDMFIAGENHYESINDDFLKIPGYRLGYWISDTLIKKFSNPSISSYADTRRGLQTGNAGLFIRKWYEVSDRNTDLNPCVESKFQKKKWYLFNSGGSFRRWYGNIIDVVNWKNQGAEIKATGKAIIPSEDRYFDELVSWNKISSGQMSVRYQPTGIIPGDASPFLHSMKQDNEIILYSMAIMNSKITAEVVKVLSPTLNFEVGNIAEIPVVIDKKIKERVLVYVRDCIEISKIDWDSFETSWDFKCHPLLPSNGSKIYRSWDHDRKIYLDRKSENIPWSHLLELAYQSWETQCEIRFNQLKSNEEELNSIFIDIYGLQDELTPEVEDKDVTVRKADLQRDIRSLISYAVGCMFGRYSLDVDGLAYAGGEWDDSKYRTFIPDADNCIPITDEPYFDDDIVELFCAWLKKVYGEETLEENLAFIAKALGNKGSTSREVIRNYFLTDFIKDHIKIYQKRPIYWLFDSGKQNGFKCLIYMHRYDRDTVGRVRSDYLRKAQDAIEGAMKNAEYTIQNSSSAVDRAAATKKRDKYIKQLNETRAYFQALSHVALQRIEIDLDDGVKINYAKFQGIETIDENGKKQKTDLLTKI